MLKKILLFILYTLLLFAFLFSSNTKVIGVLSVRHVAAIIVLMYALFNYKHIKFTNIEKSYFVYLIVYILCNIANGEFLLETFIINLLTFHFVAISIFISLPLIINNDSKIKIFIASSATVFFANCILTIMQFQNIPGAWLIGQAVNSGFDLEFVLQAAEENDGFFWGKTIAIGFAGYVVTNSYFLTTFMPIACGHIYRYDKVLIDWTCIILCIITVFVCQQRAAGVLALVFVFVYLFWFKNKRQRIVTILICLVLLLLFGQQLLNVDLGRFSDFNDDARKDISSNFIDFILSGDVLFGGLYAYIDKYGVNQHNCLLASWTMGGIFTFVAFCILYFKAILKLIKLVLMRARQDPLVFFLSSSCIIYLLYSLTHTSGLQNDGIMFWISYSILVSYIRRKPYRSVCFCKTKVTSHVFDFD